MPPSRPLAGKYRTAPQAIEPQQNTEAAPVEQTDSIRFIANLAFLQLRIFRDTLRHEFPLN
jgi:hypothetical protein